MPNQEINRLSDKIDSFLKLLELGEYLPTSKDVFEVVKKWSRCWSDEIDRFLSGKFYVHVGELKAQIVNM